MHSAPNLDQMNMKFSIDSILSPAAAAQKASSSPLMAGDSPRQHEAPSPSSPSSPQHLEQKSQAPTRNQHMNHRLELAREQDIKSSLQQAQEQQNHRHQADLIASFVAHQQQQQQHHQQQLSSQSPSGPQDPMAALGPNPAALPHHLAHQLHSAQQQAAAMAAAASHHHLMSVHHPHHAYAGQLGPQFAHLSANLQRLIHFHPYRKPKRIRTAFSPGQLIQLEQAFEKNHYVVGTERKQLAQRLNLTETQVKVWFQNRRTKHKRQKQEEGGDSKRDSYSPTGSDVSNQEDELIDDDEEVDEHEMEDQHDDSQHRNELAAAASHRLRPTTQDRLYSPTDDSSEQSTSHRLMGGGHPAVGHAHQLHNHGAGQQAAGAEEETKRAMLSSFQRNAAASVAASVAAAAASQHHPQYSPSFFDFLSLAQAQQAAAAAAAAAAAHQHQHPQQHQSTSQRIP